MQISALFELMGGDGIDLYDYVNKSSKKVIAKEAIKQYIPELHDVADYGKRPDKTIMVPGTEVNTTTNKPIYVEDTAKVTRAPLMIQKYIIGQKGSFARGNGVILKPTIEDSKVFDQVKRNWSENKTDFDLKEIAVRQMSETQCAIIFYGEKGKDKLDQFKFRYKIVSPLKGDELFPFYDEDTDDFIAFGRKYKRNKKNIYDFYVMNEQGFCEIHRFINGKPKMVADIADETKENREVIQTKYTKLPVVFFDQDEGECNDTKVIIEELESGFSDYLTQMGYTADPILFAKGAAMDLPAKGVAGKFIETADPAGDLKYLTPDNATEARDLQFKMLIKFIFSLNRSVLLDLETLKGLGAVSGAALERFLIDVYMDATDRQQGSWGKGIQRMVNWMVSQWIMLEQKDYDLRVDVMFSKYSLQDDQEKVNLALAANGGKPVIDHETSIGIAGLVDNAGDTLKKIEEETKTEVATPPVDVVV